MPGKPLTDEESIRVVGPGMTSAIEARWKRVVGFLNKEFGRGTIVRYPGSSNFTAMTNRGTDVRQWRVNGPIVESYLDQSGYYEIRVKRGAPRTARVVAHLKEVAKG